MALVVTDNSPAAGSIAWTGLTITKNITDYNIDDGNSDKKYLWWDYDSPNTLQESDTQPTLEDDDGDRLVFLNISGTHSICIQATIPHGSQIKTGTLPLVALEEDPHPAGMVHPWAGAVADIPTGWLHCDGSSLVRTAYSDLFSAIGTIHGAADGSHFNVPDLRDVSIMGAKQDDSGVPKSNVSGSLTQEGGSKDHTLAESEIPAHTHGSVGNHQHGIRYGKNGGSGSFADILKADGSYTTMFSGSAGAHTHNSVGGGGAHNNLHPYYVLTYIIKT
jgi:microcystin-dependent protein